MTRFSLWNELIAAALERRMKHHEKVKELRPKTAGFWHSKFPLSNRQTLAHYLALLRIGPSVVEPFAFSGAYRLASQMPDGARVDMRAFRHAFVDKMGSAAWFPTSGGGVIALRDRYFEHGIEAMTRRVYSLVEGYLSTSSNQGPWTPDHSGWHPVHPERHFSERESKLLRQRVGDLLTDKFGKGLFRDESVPDGMKVRALALAFDT